MKKKVLFVATVTRHINAFHIPYLKYFKEKGYEVHVASNGDEDILYCDKHYEVEFEREPLKSKNIKAYKKLKNIIYENDYDIIHCHTPVAGVLTRLAAKKARKRGTKIIYTAHGFHFYKGAPLKNWLLFYPIEKNLAKHTDVLITINVEDYELAKKKFKAKKIERVHGIGVDKQKFDISMTETERNKIRESFSVGELDYLIMYAAELNKNKNQIMLIDAMKILVKSYPNIKLILAGTGILEEEYRKEITKSCLQSNILLIGYRTDIPKLLKISDLYVATSKREGLPINIVEAMVSGLPLVVTNSRGQRELVEDGKNGYIVKLGDVNALVEKIRNIYLDYRIKKQFTTSAKEKSKPYLLENVFQEMKNIYNA